MSPAQTPIRPWLVRAAALALALALSACGGGGGGNDLSAPAAPVPSAPADAPTPATSTPPVADAVNVLPIVLDRGTDQTAINSPFVTVTVCEPGTQNCRTIDHILLDTGSVGLRISAAAAAGLSLPALPANGGGVVAECTSFASGFTWGSVRTADVRLGGEQASALSVQVMDDPASAFATVPAACSGTGSRLFDGGSKGILGVGFSPQDCGRFCADSSAADVYFSCKTGGCTSVAVPVASQVAHPVAALPADNNGLAIVLPDIPPGGAQGLAGSLVLGVGTRSNNQVGALRVFTADSGGNFKTTYQGRTSTAFIDSGSNGIFFADSTIPLCSSGFYCPRSPLSLSATATGINGTSASVPFTVENSAALPFGTSVARLGGSVVLGSSFDWGLPFFLGRTVFVAIQGRSTPAGTGPFWAF